MKPRTQAELDAAMLAFYGDAYTAHVEDWHLKNSMERAAYVDAGVQAWKRRYDYSSLYTERAHGTGLGPVAHHEAQESGRMQAEYSDSMKAAREYTSKGGRR